MIYRWFGLTSTTGSTSNSSGNIPYHLLYGGLHAPVQSAHRLDPVHPRRRCALELDRRR
jgi:hypothetical protein